MPDPFAVTRSPVRHRSRAGRRCGAVADDEVDEDAVLLRLGRVRRRGTARSPRSARARRPCPWRRSPGAPWSAAGRSRRDSGESSNPTTEMSSGTRSPASSAACTTAAAIRSEKHSTAVGRSGPATSARAPSRDVRLGVVVDLHDDRRHPGLRQGLDPAGLALAGDEVRAGEADVRTPSRAARRVHGEDADPPVAQVQEVLGAQPATRGARRGARSTRRRPGSPSTNTSGSLRFTSQSTAG